MTYSVTTEIKGRQESFEIEEEGVYYLAFDEGAVHLFRKPTRDQHVVLLLHKGSVFVGHEGVTEEVKFGEPHLCGDLNLVVSAISSMDQHVERLNLLVREHMPTTTRSKALIIGVLFVLFATVYFVAIRGGNEQEDTSAVEVSEYAAVEERDKVSELIEMRYKLAQRAVEQGHGEKALGLIGKILSVDKSHAGALALKVEAEKIVERNTQKGRDELARDVWTQKLLLDANRKMAQGDYVGARFDLRQILDRNPEHAAALEMQREIARFEQTQKAKRKNEQAEGETAAVSAEKAFREGKESYQAGKYRLAYQDLNKAMTLLREHSLHPDYELDLNEYYEKARSHVESEVDNLMGKANENYAAGMKAGGSKVKAGHFRQALKAIHEAEGSYENVEGGTALRKKVAEALDEALKPLYVEAITLQELEGCCFANAKLAEIKQLAAFPEVQYYQLSESAMNRCPCER